MDKHINPARKNDYIYFVKAVCSSAFQQPPPLPCENADWNFLKLLSEYNGCQNLFLNAVEKLPLLPPDGVYKQMQETSSRLLVQDVNQQFELDRLFEEFEKNGVCFLPMKGYVIKPYYPRSDFRLMTDCDILFRNEQIEKVKEIYKSLGFSFVLYDNENQYHFEKKPYLYIEMHSSLLGRGEEKYAYFSKVWEKAHPAGNSACRCEMTPEDYYIFMIEHASKHFKQGGIGLRHLIDMLIFSNGNSLNRAYLDKELEALGLLTFEKKMYEIAVKWFVKQDFNEFSLLEEAILLCGSLGRRELSFANMSLDYQKKAKKSNKKPSKAAFVLKSIFHGKSTMAILYPYLEKMPFLLPVAWVQFWFKRIFIDRDISVKTGIKNRMDYVTSEDEEYIRAIMRETGFSE